MKQSSASEKGRLLWPDSVSAGIQISFMLKLLLKENNIEENNKAYDKSSQFYLSALCAIFLPVI